MTSRGYNSLQNNLFTSQAMLSLFLGQVEGYPGKSWKSTGKCIYGMKMISMCHLPFLKTLTFFFNVKGNQGRKQESARISMGTLVPLGSHLEIQATDHVDGEK